LPESGAWPPEVDIEEIRGDVPKAVYMTNHTGHKNTSMRFMFSTTRNLSDVYHIYGVLLTVKTISWFVDGVRQGQTSQGADEATPMFIVLSFYTGKCNDGWAGCPDKARDWSSDSFVRWIRVWQGPNQ
jgi:beta-glucanase (GH16 family)